MVYKPYPVNLGAQEVQKIFLIFWIFWNFIIKQAINCILEFPNFNKIAPHRKDATDRAAQTPKLPGSTDLEEQNFLRKCMI
jgi:hypothetical protein